MNIDKKKKGFYTELYALSSLYSLQPFTHHLNISGNKTLNLQILAK